MPAVRIALALLAVLLAAISPSGVAAPIAVQVGNQRLMLDAPAGFSDTAFLYSPRLKELAETLTSASSRTLLFALADDDLRRFMNGDRTELRRYMAVATPTGLERTPVGEAEFRAFVAEFQRDKGAAPTARDYWKHLDAQPDGKLSLLAELVRQPTRLSILQGALFTTEGRFFGSRKQYLLLATTLVLVRGKVLLLAIYSDYESAADVDWITGTTERWLDALLRLNR